MRETLVLEEIIASSHEDFDVWAIMVAGFNMDKRFIVQFDYYNTPDTPNPARSIKAVMPQDEAYQLSRVLRTDLIRLPVALQQRFAPRTNEMVMPEHVEAQFKLVLDFLLDRGINYKLIG
ncbi:MAG: hypothetical protein ACI308_02190 [Muribaculaceae bacterium]